MVLLTTSSLFHSLGSDHEQYLSAEQIIFALIIGSSMMPQLAVNHYLLPGALGGSLSGYLDPSYSAH